jgi:hypothetical protein
MHIKGMLLWNGLEYENFIPGTKGYLFKIMGVDTFNAPKRIIEKLSNVNVGNVIVIPEDVELLPKYYIIDTVAMMSFAWDDRVNELIAPITHQVFTQRREEAVLTW